MVEVTLLDALGPFLNIMGGLAGLTIVYFVIMAWIGRRKLQTLARIEREQERARRRASDVIRLQRQTLRAVARLERRVGR